MSELSVAQIGQRLAEGSRLTTRPVCVYGTDRPPAAAEPITSVHRCVARVLYRIAVDATVPAVYVGGDDALEGTCGGGQAYLGYSERHWGIKYFVSTGSPDFRDGAAEYLASSPEQVEEGLAAVGAITALGTYCVLESCGEVADEASVRAVICFGSAEQVRNLCTLAAFRRFAPFGGVIVPSGAACATLVTYPGGLAAKAPRGAAFVGPSDPTGNAWFAPDHLAIAMPLAVARRMAEDVPASFLTRRPHVAFPERRLSVGRQ